MNFLQNLLQKEEMQGHPHPEIVNKFEHDTIVVKMPQHHMPPPPPPPHRPPHHRAGVMEEARVINNFDHNTFIINPEHHRPEHRWEHHREEHKWEHEHPRPEHRGEHKIHRPEVPRLHEEVERIVDKLARQGPVKLIMLQ